MYSSLSSKDRQNSTNRELKILIIDDDRKYVERLSYSLKNYREGIKVITAVSGKIGLDHIKNNGFHLILLDLKMPGMNGAEVLRHIRRMSKKYIVIILTAFAEDDLIQQAKKEKPEEIFDKASFTLESLDPYLGYSK